MEIKTNCDFRGLINYFLKEREELVFCLYNAKMNYP